MQLVIGCCTVDVLRHLSSEEASRNPAGATSDRLARLASHIIGQQRWQFVKTLLCEDNFPSQPGTLMSACICFDWTQLLPSISSTNWCAPWSLKVFWSFAAGSTLGHSCHTFRSLFLCQSKGFVCFNENSIISLLHAYISLLWPDIIRTFWNWGKDTMHKPRQACQRHVWWHSYWSACKSNAKGPEGAVVWQCESFDHQTIMMIQVLDRLNNHGPFHIRIGVTKLYVVDLGHRVLYTVHDFGSSTKEQIMPSCI